MSFSGWMGKQMVVYPCHEMLLSNSKEITIGTHNNLDELEVNYAEWKQPISKGYISYYSIYRTFLKWQKFRNRALINGGQELAKVGECMQL